MRVNRDERLAERRDVAEIEMVDDEEAEAGVEPWGDHVGIVRCRSDWRASVNDHNYRERVQADDERETGKTKGAKRASGRSEEENETTVALTSLRF